MNIVAFRPGLRTCPAPSPPIGKKVIMPIIMLSQSVFTYFFSFFQSQWDVFPARRRGSFSSGKVVDFSQPSGLLYWLAYRSFPRWRKKKLHKNIYSLHSSAINPLSRWSPWIMRLSEFWQVRRAKGLAAGKQFSRGEGSERSYCNLRPTDNGEGWESNKDKRPGSVAGEVQIAFPSCFDLFQ